MKHSAKKNAKKSKPHRVHKMGAGKHSKGCGAHKMGGRGYHMGGRGHCKGRGLGKLVKKVTPRKALGAARVVLSAAEKNSSGRQKDFLKAARLITSKNKKQRREGVDLAVGTALKQAKESSR